MPVREVVQYADFERVDIHVGTIIAAEPFPEARKPAYKLTVDFGLDIGIKRSSAQITEKYSCAELIGTQVIAVVNFPPKQIGPFSSEVLTLGLAASDGTVVLLRPTEPVPNGQKIF